MYQRVQHFSHANLAIYGGAAGAGRSQLPLCGPVRRLRENQRATPDKEHGSRTCDAHEAKTRNCGKWIFFGSRTGPDCNPGRPKTLAF